MVGALRRPRHGAARMVHAEARAATLDFAKPYQKPLGEWHVILAVVNSRSGPCNAVCSMHCIFERAI